MDDQTENFTHEVFKLISLEDDPKVKSSLILFLKMIERMDKADSRLIDHNRRLTDAENEMKGHSTLVVQATASFKVMAFFIAAIQTILMGTLGYAFESFKETRDKVQSHDTSIVRIQAEVDNLLGGISGRKTNF